MNIVMNEINQTKAETKGGELETHNKLGEGWVSKKTESSVVFLGEYRHKLDDKGRLALPKDFRISLENGAVVTRGLDGCLFVYPKSDWRELAEKIARLPITNANARAFARLMLAGAMEIRFDKQGRVIIPTYLRHYAALKNKVIVAGVYNRLEIWSRGKWARYKKNAEENSSSIAENLAELGI
jgi:MraZ protein